MRRGHGFPMGPPDSHQVRGLGTIRGREPHEPHEPGKLVRGRPNGRHGAHRDRGGTQVEHAALLYPGTPGGGPVGRRPPFNRGDGDSGMRRPSEKGSGSPTDVFGGAESGLASFSASLSPTHGPPDRPCPQRCPVIEAPDSPWTSRRGFVIVARCSPMLSIPPSYAAPSS